MFELLAKIKNIWAYVSFYFRNKTEAHDILDEGMDLLKRAFALAEKFKKENPEVPLEWLPTPKDTEAAIKDERAGKTETITPKPVSEWTMREWEIYWNLGNGAM